MSVGRVGRINGPATKRRKLSHSPDANTVAINHNVNRNSPDSGSKDEIPAKEGHENESSVSTRRRRPGQGKESSSTNMDLPFGGMTKTSVLTMQIQELLREVTPKYASQLSRLKSLTDRITSTIQQMSGQGEIDLSTAEKTLWKRGVAIPFPEPRPGKDTKYKFEYQPPSSISLRGDLPRNLSLKGSSTVEIMVTMPGNLLQEKDYLNHRALHKRAYYLAEIAAGISDQTKDDFHLSYAFEDDLQLVPILLIQSHGQSEDSNILIKHNLKISVGFQSDAIPVARTLPTKNCVRLQHATGNATDGEGLPPTPFYNSCIRRLASTTMVDQLLTNVSQKCAAFNDTCRLGQVWLRQRGFGSPVSRGGFGFEEWALTCALLLYGGGARGQPLFSHRYSTIQLFKAMLQFLAGKDLLQPMILNGPPGLELPVSLSPVLLGGAAGYNVFYKVTPSSYRVLKDHAQVSLTAINARNQDNFDAIFILRVSEPVVEYDDVYALSLAKQNILAAGQIEVLVQLYALLSRGLGDRVTMIDIRPPPTSNWDVKHTQQSQHGEDLVLSIGLLMNPDSDNRTVDHGPSAEEPEAAEDFRKFWGEKSELRRFKDGSISESLVWSSDSAITQQIIRHLTVLHLKVPPSSLRSLGGNIESASLADDARIPAEEAFKVISSTYQTLSSALHQLEGLPLPIRSISPADPALRSASLGHPLLPSTTRPIDILIAFETSGRWPDHLPAIQHTKIAFLVKLSDLLKETLSDLETRIGLENTHTTTSGHLNTSYLDIIYPSPAPGLTPICFRLRIHHDRELNLLQTALADKSLHGSVRDSVTTALAKHKAIYIAAPIHTTAIRSLCTRFSPLSSTIRLLKKWLSSHLLLRHIPSESVEVIASNVFLNPTPWSVPGSAKTAFLRCLNFLARWNWMHDPLLVDLSLSQDMSEQTREEVQTRFQAWRKLDPSMNNVVWFVGTNIDTTGTVWTQGAKPPRVVAGRVKVLAQAAMDLIRTKGVEMGEADWKNIFFSPLVDFDFQLHLKRSVVKGQKSSGKGKEVVKYKNLQVQDELDVGKLGYDAVELYLKDLEQAFGNAVMLFYDGDGGRVVAGLWKPAVLGSKEWRVRMGYSTVPLKSGEAEKDVCEVNKEGILAEISALGRGLVERITVKE